MKTLHRAALAILLALVLSVSTASLSSAASPAQHAAPTLGPAVPECTITTDQFLANSGWQGPTNGIQVYAQVWQVVDYYNGHYCGYKEGKVGIWFRNTTPLCATEFADLYGFHADGIAHGLTGANQYHCGVYGQSFVFWTPAVYVGYFYCEYEVHATLDSSSTQAFAFYHDGC